MTAEAVFASNRIVFESNRYWIKIESYQKVFAPCQSNRIKPNSIWQPCIWYSDWAWSQKAIGEIYFTKKKVKSWDSTTCFRLWQFQTPAWKRYLQMHLLAERFTPLGWWLRFCERGSQDLSNGTNVASSLADFSLSSHVLSICYLFKFSLVVPKVKIFRGSQKFVLADWLRRVEYSLITFSSVVPKAKITCGSRT
jgi:hypothetical protein